MMANKMIEKKKRRDEIGKLMIKERGEKRREQKRTEEIRRMNRSRRRKKQN